MSGVQEIYNQLFAGKTLHIDCGDAKGFETLRTGLVRKNSFMKVLGAAEDEQSVLAQFDPETNIGMFKLGQSARKLAGSRWRVVSVDGKVPDESAE